MEWHGFQQEIFEFEGHEAIIVFPDRGNGRLAVKTEYWDAFPEAAEIDLVKAGFHLCYIRNDNRWGTDADLDRKARFVSHVTETCSLEKKAVPVGMSCGGLFAIKFAAKYPELVSCLYLDAPVLNYMSCPCGFGVGEVLDGGTGIPEILDALSMQSISELLGYREMPLDMVPQLIRARIPVVMVAGGKDRTVPYCENGANLQKAYEKTDIDFRLFIKPDCDHHPHGLEDNQEVVKFILEH